jgi:nicotinamidase-related amidase
MIELDPPSTALVLIDLQKGILGFTLTPRSDATGHILPRLARLVQSGDITLSRP